ncbi:MAG: ribonuclease III [Verrucomicrobiota bacterium]
MSSPLDDFQQCLGHIFADEALLRQALTHASYGHEKRQRLPDNQRLEFLGDAVLQLAVTSELYRRFPALTEGQLTVLRARLVNKQRLHSVAQELGLGEHLILGRGEENSQGRNRPTILADAMEAVIGAVFAEAGWEPARAIILRLLEPALAAMGEEGDAAVANPKGALQERLQADGEHPPAYRCVAEDRPGPRARLRGGGRVAGARARPRPRSQQEGSRDARGPGGAGRDRLETWHALTLALDSGSPDNLLSGFARAASRANKRSPQGVQISW